jgi:hypothetical protein
MIPSIAIVYEPVLAMFSLLNRPLLLHLVGYTSDDLLYKWTTGRGVNIASDMKLSQFDLISTPTGNETTLRNRGTATRNHAKTFSEPRSTRPRTN